MVRTFFCKAKRYRCKKYRIDINSVLMSENNRCGKFRAKSYRCKVCAEFTQKLFALKGANSKENSTIQQINVHGNSAPLKFTMILSSFTFRVNFFDEKIFYAHAVKLSKGCEFVSENTNRTVFLCHDAGGSKK